jgi:hypothetical protein
MRHPSNAVLHQEFLLRHQQQREITMNGRPSVDSGPTKATASALMRCKSDTKSGLG